MYVVKSILLREMVRK